MARPKVILLDQQSAYLPGTKCAVTTTSRSMIAEPKTEPFAQRGKDGKSYRIVPWGDKNNLPAKIMETCYRSPIVTAGMNFNCSSAYGDGIMYGRWKVNENGKKVFVENTHPTVKDDRVAIYMQDHGFTGIGKLFFEEHKYYVKGKKLFCNPFI